MNPQFFSIEYELIMRYIKKSDRTYASDISRVLEMDSSKLKRKLRNMVNMGWIEVSQGGNPNSIELTDSGASILKQLDEYASINC